MWGARRYLVRLLLAIVMGTNLLSTAFAQSVDIDRELREQQETKVAFLRAHPWRRFRSWWLEDMDRIERASGLRVGLSFTSIYQHGAGLDSPNNTAVGNLDVLGRWRLGDLGVLGQGTVAGLFRTRANCAELNGNDLSARIGVPWGINNSGSVGYNRFNQFWWEQALWRRTLTVKFGRLDEGSLFDQNRVASSDARQFMLQPLVQNQTVAFPSNGAGLNVRYEPSERFYVTAGFGDANGNPDVKPREGLSSFAEGQYFEAAEVGFSPDLVSLWANPQQGTYRIMGWHTAATDSHPSGSGVALGFDQEVGDGFVPFARVGVCPDEVFNTSAEVSGGLVAVRPFGRATDRAGVGVAWGQPVGPAHRDQVAMEVFYRLEVVEGIAITPDLELIAAPADQPARDFVAVVGVRIRLSL